jgi:hypothetical protein
MIKLYLDMDGVLCDFQTAYTNMRTGAADNAKRFRAAVIDYKIFEDLEFMPDAKELLAHVRTLPVHIEILTSVGTYDPFQGEDTKRQKKLWLSKHNIPYKPNFVRSKQEKAEYATPRSILIDDSIGCVKPFEFADGHAILHTTAKKTILELDNLILQLSALSAMR